MSMEDWWNDNDRAELKERTWALHNESPAANYQSHLSAMFCNILTSTVALAIGFCLLQLHKLLSSPEIIQPRQYVLTLCRSRGQFHAGARVWRSKTKSLPSSRKRERKKKENKKKKLLYTPWDQWAGVLFGLLFLAGLLTSKVTYRFSLYTRHAVRPDHVGVARE